MHKRTIILLHGFASSGNSSKAQFLGARFKNIEQVQFAAIDFNPTIKDFEYMTITGMINRLRQHVLQHAPGDLLLMGSSMGALVGLHYAHRYGGVSRMVLLAPALTYGQLVSETERRGWMETGVLQVQHYAFNREIPLRYEMHLDGQQYNSEIKPPAPITIIHGRHDDVVPVALSQRYAAKYPDEVILREVDSDHRLSNQHELIWQQVAP